MSNEAGLLLHNLVATTGTFNEVNDSEGFGSLSNFEDFERDLDFINEHLEEDSSETDDNQLTEDESQENDSAVEANSSNYNEEASSCSSAADKFTLAMKLDEQQNSSFNEIELSASDKPIKKVSFNLSENTEYSDDFESSIEEDFEDEAFEEDSKNLPSSCQGIIENVDGSSEVHCEEDPAQNSDCKACTSELINELDLMTGIRTCSTCNCRLTRMHILDTTELSDLFSKQKIKGKRKLGKNKSQKMKKNRKDGFQTCDKATEDVEKGNEDGVKQLKKPPTNTFWNKSSNSSLLQWLKLKNKEERIKRATKKKERKEKKQTKKQEEFAKLWRKEISERKFQEWMKRKKQEERAVRKHKVAPYSEAHLLQSPSNPPYGYTVLDSFEKKEVIMEDAQPRAKGTRKMSNKQKLTNEQQNSKNKVIEVSAPEYKNTGSKYEARKSYDEWLQEKKLSSVVASKKHQAIKASDDGKLYANERVRRQTIKDNSMKKVDSNLGSRPRSTPARTVTFREHVPEPIKGQKQQYKWADKRSNVERH